MAGKQAQPVHDGSPAPTEGLPSISNISGMSKPKIYEVMSQMKALIEQDQQQAREILVNNPLFTRALFQAQIILGMVKPAQADQQEISQPQPMKVGQAVNVQAAQSLPGQHGVQGQPSSAQTPVVPGQKQSTQTPLPLPPASVPPFTLQSQAIPSQLPSAHNKSFLDNQIPPMPPPQPSQVQNQSLPTAPQLSTLPAHMPVATAQPQHPLQNPGLVNQPLQPLLPQQPRLPAMRPYGHQLHPQMAHSLGFQPSNAPQQLLSQSLFNPGFPTQSSFPQVQPPLPSQPPPHQLYQGGSHVGHDYSYVAGTSIQADRIGPWVPGLPEIATGTHLQGQPPPMIGEQMNLGSNSKLPRPPPLSADMENQLLQQVMSLTAEQINLLPPEQRHQVLQLQKTLR